MDAEGKSCSSVALVERLKDIDPHLMDEEGEL